ncbi:hypothetical protein IVB41_16085 [Bradyrhizobium sp. 44]|uniref:hypothetical protein n=1 Tax=Bradyrhizobium sp. 44 TaxID=2782675 RepID=UPI001FF98325|nr:hypothetical protein [Bradyrhizobium sp. 44]MCK1285439.1 hypothetical protein [Bradyrhizobium sp. 44]
MADATKQPATAHDVLVVLTQTNILARALVASGLLQKEEICKQIDVLSPMMDKIMQLELENFRQTIEKWPSQMRQ